MGDSSSVADYITRGQLLPGPVLQTVTHSRDIKSLAEKNTAQAEKPVFSLCCAEGEIPGKRSKCNCMFHVVFICFVLAGALWAYLRKQLLLKSHGLSGCEAVSSC